MGLVTNLTNITNPAGLLAMPNTETGGWFWFAILLMVFVVLLLSLINFSFEISLMVSSFVSFAASLLLLYASLVGLKAVLIYFSLFLGMIIYTMWSSTRESV